MVTLFDSQVVGHDSHHSHHNLGISPDSKFLQAVAKACGHCSSHKLHGIDHDAIANGLHHQNTAAKKSHNGHNGGHTANLKPDMGSWSR